LKAGLRTEAATSLSNLSSLYFHVKDTTSALASAQEAYRLVGKEGQPEQRSEILAQLGRVLLIRGDGARAMPIFREAIEVAFYRGDARTEALAWDQMGAEFMRSNDLARAEDALTRAFGLRRLNRDPFLFATEYKLALLRLRQGDVRSARMLIDAVLREPHRDPVQIPPHHIYLARARILQAEGDLKGALEEYLRATDAAEEWRSRGLFADRFRISTDDLLDEVYDGAIGAAAQLYRQSGNQEYAVLSWQLDESIRAASLRELMKQGRDWTKRVPPEYWQMLDQLRALDAERFASQDPAVGPGAEEAARLRMHLAELEAHASAEESRAVAPPSSAGGVPTHWAGPIYTVSQEKLSQRISLTHFRKVLGISRTLISFHLGEKISYRWVVTNQRLDLKLLPPADDLAAAVKALRSAIQTGASAMAEESENLYLKLFGDIAHTGAGQRWCVALDNGLVALDNGLFELPVAGLVTGRRDGKPTYIVEQRAIEMVPGAWALTLPSRTSNQGFVGIGDGIYNTADPRYRAEATRDGKWSGSVAALPALLAKNPDSIQLPRLIASGKELTDCARQAGGTAVILTGVDANRQRFLTALAGEPRIIHIAAHFLTERDGEKNTAIALGIRPDRGGKPRFEILTADDLARLQVPGSIVVMSGCSSAAGRVVPAAGLLGLARAWLAAGASAVVATQWPTPDDTGDLLAEFYEHLRDTVRGDRIVPAEALRRAQVDMIHSATTRAEVRYWAAYQIIGRSN
jgi:CHAT domain-containing protein